ncbi:unnamed protein product [Oncorhynchus mykiss]|uniref:Uncharacterized protein n=1 Tax=Oncorhynchus mykiss TaxID=8022 RepID=A0A060YAK9_ONCMY|nr:unnamed protein product [Oncorhynchus mykiss]
MNALDTLGQTALHRAAMAGHLQTCRMLLSYGADASILSLQGFTASQMGNEAVQQILSENVPVRNSDVDYQLLEAAKAGDLDTVKSLCSPQNVNCRDLEGRHSTPLHFAAGYNRVAVVEYLLHHGADVHAKDKGMFLFLPQHVDIAALLIKYNTCVNATDKWAFTPLHEAAQKGRTQLCALLLAHGADPSMKNQEGQAPLDLATADDIRALLIDAMPPDALPSCFKPQATVVSASVVSTAVISPASTPSCLSAASSIDNLAGSLSELTVAGATGPADGATGSDRKDKETVVDMNISQFLKSLGLEHLRDIFQREQVNARILVVPVRANHFHVYCCPIIHLLSLTPQT